MLIIGTRGSALAMTQTRWVKDRILSFHPGTEIEIRIIKTSADRDQKSSIRSGTATAVFVKEIEDALLAREIDLAVHSLKDVPTRIPDSLMMAAIPEREDPRDALVVAVELRSLDDLPRSSIVGTGSVRRQAQLLHARPDLTISDIRGNVDTRIRKMEDGAYQAIVLACAGLRRLGLEARISLPLNLGIMLPAPGQGALGLETRKDDSRTPDLVKELHHHQTAHAVFAERAFLHHMGGGCNSPIAVHAWVENGGLCIDGLVAAPDGSRVIRDRIGPVPGNPEDAAADLAESLLSRGAGTILGASH
jgi:hydroxymethylbilane synthase